MTVTLFTFDSINTTVEPRNDLPHADGPLADRHDIGERTDPAGGLDSTLELIIRWKAGPGGTLTANWQRH